MILLLDSDEAEIISILVVAEAAEVATAGEEAADCIQHLEHGGLLLFPFPSRLLPRVKVHLSCDDSHVMMSSSTLIVAWFFKV